MKCRDRYIVKNYVFIICILSIFMLHVAASFANADVEKRQVIQLEFFYMNPCGMCDDEAKFRDKLNDLLGAERKDFLIRLNSYNTFKENDSKLFDEYSQKYGIPKEKQKLPILFINGQVLAGESEIDMKLKEVIMEQKQTVVSNILYFYVTSCGECDKVSKYLAALDSLYMVDSDGKALPSTLSIRKLNVEDTQNLELVRSLFKQYSVPDKLQEVPVIFYNGGYLSGEETIRQSLVSEIKKGKAIGDIASGVDGNTNDVAKPVLNGYQTVGVFFTGLLNGFNPCSISMLLFFMSLLLVKQYSILKLGIAFILGKFVAYTMLGTILYSVLLKAGGWFHTFQGVLKYLLVAVSLLLAFINLLDYLAAKNEKYGKIRLQLPRRFREVNHSLIQKLTASGSFKYLLPVSFLLGVIISAGEFLCTGQIYLATIVYVVKNSPVLDLQAVMYFLLYGLAMILPLLGLTLLVHKGREIFDVTEVVRTKMHLIKMANGLFFLVFAVVILLFF